MKLEVFAKDIGGIIYYVDKWENVYVTEEILFGKQNPGIFTSQKDLLQFHSDFSLTKETTTKIPHVDEGEEEASFPSNAFM